MDFSPVYLPPDLPADQPTLTMTRVFQAPRTLVWKLWTDPYHLTQWWGPKGYTNPVCRMDVRPGGRWSHVMRGPDGTEYPVESEYLEVVPPERIVYRNAKAEGEIWGDNPPPSFVRTITFTEAGGETTVTIRAEFKTFEERDRIVRRGFATGTNESLDKLAEHIRQLGNEMQQPGT
jgi:uncharacterized protein YndB with AHSA1/START domain